MAEKTYTVGSQLRVGGKLLRVGERITCDPKDLAGVEHCVTPVDTKAEAAAAKAAAEAEAAAAKAE